MKVRFSQPVAEFEVGRVYDLPDSSAFRWVKRGLAEILPPEVRQRATPPVRANRPATVRPKVQA